MYTHVLTDESDDADIDPSSVPSTQVCLCSLTMRSIAQAYSRAHSACDCVPLHRCVYMTAFVSQCLHVHMYARVSCLQNAGTALSRDVKAMSFKSWQQWLDHLEGVSVNHEHISVCTAHACSLVYSLVPCVCRLAQRTLQQTLLCVCVIVHVLRSNQASQKHLKAS
jgi:hypothetical protein